MCIETSISPSCRTLRPGTGTKVLGGHLSRTVGPGDMGDTAQGNHRGNGVAARRGVAKVAANAGASLDLDSTNERSAIYKTWVGAGDRLVLVDLVTGDRGSQGQPGLGIVGDLIEFGYAFGVHNQVETPASSSHLHQQVRAAGQHPGSISLGCHQFYGFVDGVWLRRNQLLPISHLLAVGL